MKNKSIALLGMLFFLLMGISGISQAAQGIQKSSNKDAKYWHDKLENGFKKISLKEGKISLEPNNDTQKFFPFEDFAAAMASPNDTFEWVDEHGSVMFILKKIIESGIMIEYESRSDLRSFGENKVKIDHGSFELNWKP